MQHLLNLPYNTHSKFLPHTVENKQVELQVHLHVAGFYQRKKKNGLLRLCHKLASSGS